MTATSFRYEYDVIGADFFDTAAWSMEGSAVVQASTHDVFALLVDDATWSTWYPRMGGCQWTSELPVEVGSTRDIRVQQRRTFEQEVVAFEPGVRLAFRFSKGNQWQVQAGLEEFVLRPTGTNSCELRWRHAIESKPIMKPMMLMGHFVLKIHPMGGLVRNRVPKSLAKFLSRSSS